MRADASIPAAEGADWWHPRAPGSPEYYMNLSVCGASAHARSHALMCRYESACTQREAAEEWADENDESKEIPVRQRGAGQMRLAGSGECHSRSAPDH